MPSAQVPPVLAEAADVLSDQLRAHLRRLAVLLRPEADALEARFLKRLVKLRFDPGQRRALATLTAGGAARTLGHGGPPADFLEQVEYNGRRLAKMNLPPGAIREALAEYDRLLTPVLRRLIPAEYRNFQWVREQLQFCVLLTLNNAYYQVREAETEAFFEMFRAELESRTLEELLERFLAILTQFCRAQSAHLFLLDDTETVWTLKASVTGNGAGHASGAVARKGKVIRAWLRKGLGRPRYLRGDGRTSQYLLNPAWRKCFPSCWSVPLTAGQRIAGVMQFGFAKAYEWLPREEQLLTAAAERCLMAAEKAHLMQDLADRQQQVRQLAQHMMDVEELERRRISRELHDQAGQDLLCIRLQMELLEQALPDSQREQKARLSEARDLIERTILEIRRLIAALSPAVLEQLGLGAALRHLVNRFRRLHTCQVRLHLPRLGNLPKKLEVIVYRLMQECCNNIAKHSFASRVNISVSSADGILRLHVEDDGIGFQAEEAARARDSFGLAGIRERVELLGGRFEVRSRPRGLAKVGRLSGSGTRISVELPIPRENEKEGKRHRPTQRRRSEASPQASRRLPAAVNLSQ